MIAPKHILVSLLLAAGLGLQSLPASAHELLPRPVLEYLEANPEATPEDIQAFAQTQSPDIAEQFENKERTIELIANQPTSFLDNFWDFIKLGVEHILSGPDHILFVLTLVLVFGSVREILKLTGTFTVAHSLTIILAGSGLLTLSSNIVEPIIALSIAYVAITSVFLTRFAMFKTLRAKLVTVFAFGLFHGLGFAGLLEEIQIPADRFVSSLLAFNVGIEIGQLIILGIILPPILYFRDRSWYPTLVKIIAITISIIALVWFVQRVFFV